MISAWFNRYWTPTNEQLQTNAAAAQVLKQKKTQNVVYIFISETMHLKQNNPSNLIYFLLLPHS